VLFDNANCTMELTKIDYDQPGNDSNDFIELHVTKKNPGLVTTLLDCGVGAIALYDDTSVLCAPYSLTVLATVVIPSDGYLEIGQNQPTVNVSVGASPEGWIHNGRGEIAILSSALASGVPLNWFQYEGAAKCNGLLVPTQIQAEDETAPNSVNVSCNSTFHLVVATNATQKTTADCPSGGSGGASGGGGTSSGGGAGGLLNLAGGGGLLNLAGGGGLLNLAGGGGLLNLAGGGGLLNLAGGAGLLDAPGGGGSTNQAGAGTAGSNPSGEGGLSNVSGQAGANAAGEDAGGSAGVANAGDAGDENSVAGNSNSQGGGSAAGAGNGTAGAGNGTAGAGNGTAGDSDRPLVAEGGGCSCAIPKAQNHRPIQALILFAALLGLCVRRRNSRAH